MSTQSGHPSLDLPWEGQLGNIGKICPLYFKISKSANEKLARSSE